MLFVKLRRGHTGVQWVPNPVWLVSLSKGNIWTQRRTRTERTQFEKTQGGDGHLQAMERGLGWILPHNPPTETALLAPWSWPSSLLSCDTVHFCYLSCPACASLLCFALANQYDGRWKNQQDQTKPNISGRKQQFQGLQQLDLQNLFRACCEKTQTQLSPITLSSFSFPRWESNWPSFMRCLCPRVS